MSLNITRDGYGQVEFQQMSAQRTGQIFASLPLDEDVNVLQNGEFMYYDKTTGKVSGTSTAITEPYLVYNEEKLYTDFATRKDFAMIRKGDNYTTENNVVSDDPVMSKITPTPVVPQNAGYRMIGFAPRLYKVNIGDIYTTNMVKLGAYKIGDKLQPVYNATTKTMQLEVTTSPTAGLITFVVLKETDMPDGQPAVQIQRVA